MVSREVDLSSCVYNAGCHIDENVSVALEGKEIDKRDVQPPPASA